MTTYNEQTAMQGISERFAKAADELRLTGRQLYRDEIVANDQVLSKIKSGRQKPTKKAIELFCQKYGVSAAWMYDGNPIESKIPKDIIIEIYKVVGNYRRQ